MVEELQGDVFHCKGKSIESKIEGITRFKAALSGKKTICLNSFALTFTLIGQNVPRKTKKEQKKR